ncbi:MAG: sulfatase-like hydrolase/transferase [Pseudomonadales bacterium]
MTKQPRFRLPSHIACLIVGFALLAGSPGLKAAVNSLEANTETTQAEQPNFLFILTDDQTVNTIGALGNSEILTPNMDRLAAQGTSFTHVFNQGAWSGAVCAPSRRMINTGRHLYRTGLGPKTAKNDHAKKYPLMGEVLQQAGYETFMTGKWHVDNASFRRSFSLGSAIYEGGMSAEGKGGQFEPRVAEYDGNDDNPENFVVRTENKHTSELLADSAITYLQAKEQRNDKPFFMYVAFLAPHDPRQSPQEYVDMYPASAITLPPNFLPEHPFDEGDHYIRDEVLLPFPRVEATVKPFIGEYYAMITHLDAQIGRILDTLDSSPYADNTIVIFTSDHGLAAGQHGLLGKQSQYDASIRAPFIISGPGIPVAKQAPGMFYLHSIFPTVLDLADIAIPDSVDTASITPLIRGERDTEHEAIYGAYKHFQRMVRTDNYKLIYYPMLKKTQLFDLQNDPWEMNDLSDDPENAQLIIELQAQLETLKQAVGDPLKNDTPEASFAEYMSKSKARRRVELKATES